MSKPFVTKYTGGIGEIMLNNPPVNAFDCAGWLAIASEIRALGEDNEAINSSAALYRPSSH